MNWVEAIKSLKDAILQGDSLKIADEALKLGKGALDFLADLKDAGVFADAHAVALGLDGLITVVADKKVEIRAQGLPPAAWLLLVDAVIEVIKKLIQK